MKILSIALIFVLTFNSQLFSQIKDHTFTFNKLNRINNSPPKHFYIGGRLIFEYGFLMNLTDKGMASTVSSSYDFNLISKKLYGSIQGGALFIHDEDESGTGLLFGLGFDYSLYTENKYNFSVYVGGQGLILGIPAVFGVIHLRNSILTDFYGAFTFGVRYLPRIGMNEHWLMPTFGYQLLLK